MQDVSPNTPVERFEGAIREAAREYRRVMVRLEIDPGQVAEREMEPYAIEGATLVAYSYLRDEFRRVPMADIRGVEITPRTFAPRRPVDL